ncbi:MAG: DUF1836 domain-containing protein [Clostridia bacterium]|nr:DUF1836 domain-containing protein [Clostridia bacterium]MDD4798630.1 DUF1836 domain-containing protein [Clostridia bacterium]
MGLVLEDVLSFRLPRYAELPEMDLYMEQVINTVDRRLWLFSENQEGKFATASMVNNYVKSKLISAPVKKRYNREQLARLLMIFILKRIFSISEIYAFLQHLDSKNDFIFCYNSFCLLLENTMRKVFTGDCNEDTGADEVVETTIWALAAKFYAQYLLEEKRKKQKKILTNIG